MKISKFSMGSLGNYINLLSFNLTLQFRTIKETLRKDWMFKLVGCEEFKVGESQCRINIEPFGLFAYRYSLDVNGKPFKQFIERQSKILKTWTIKTVDGTDFRIVLGNTPQEDSIVLLN
jgi:hypothetical protein